mmetsp:Transcript_6268/g.10236  ORF Transcript_6268/g.10236 Transcript_6268/m.10236 type:complete len:375 (-) Transcript_6268:49-1173(-)
MSLTTHRVLWVACLLCALVAVCRAQQQGHRLRGDTLLRCEDKDSGTHRNNINTLYARDHCHKCDWLDVKLTVIMLYHNECNSLRFLTNSWKRFPQPLRDQVRLLIIDDNAQLPACDCVEKQRSGDTRSLNDHGISVIRVEDSRPWNIGGARNMGAFFTCSEFLFVCDIDALVSQSLLQSVLALTQRADAKLHLHQFNRNFTEKSTKFHPGMMLLTRDAYWANHGCDEDFVGHYGQTDPHFRHNFVLRPHFKIVQNPDIFMCALKSPLDDSWQASLPQLDRSTRPNKQLMMQKVSRRVMWNHTVLRFHWREDSCVAPVPSAGRGSEVRQWAAAAMSRPQRDEDAFAVRSWAKTGPVAACTRPDYSHNDPCSSSSC